MSNVEVEGTGGGALNDQAIESSCAGILSDHAAVEISRGWND